MAAFPLESKLLHGLLDAAVQSIEKNGTILDVKYKTVIIMQLDMMCSNELKLDEIVISMREISAGFWDNILKGDIKAAEPFYSQLVALHRSQIRLITSVTKMKLILSKIISNLTEMLLSRLETTT
ncbi:MAG: hypothetical protein Harvfovirus22_16 [Harvfovirus sp.]|uniref:Uncharacterized protein n=1 Tax=Harvfovirus sp. TaxID=2487768 RepID=A0A3G5A4U4_9VIRU|nr:MAG: hypothetical protein Harvfovirus22_16 [Harvfovirus sp.]